VTTIALPLADGIDSGLWIWLVLAAMSVLGTILQKKKQKDEKQPQRPPGRVGRPTARPRTPAPPIPRPRRPILAPPQSGQSRPEITARRIPTEKPIRPRLVRPTPRQADVRPTAAPQPRMQPQPAPEPARELEPEPIVVEAKPAERAAPPTTGREVRKPKETRRRRSPVRDPRVRQMLADRSGLQAAFILSEILAPPAALRENHPF
jgi:hypothetical protein